MKMVNLINLYKVLLGWVMKTVAMKPQRLEIEQGTFINFWISTKNNHKQAAHGVVLLHGFGADGIFTWQFQVLALAKKYALYVPDFVFFGNSTTDKTERSPEFHAECVAKGLKMLGVEKCTLVGFSYGGMVGFKMGEMYPKLVHSMVISGGVIGLVESITVRSLERMGGVSSWSQYLLPHTAEGVRMLFRLASYKLPPIPSFLLKDYLEVYISSYLINNYVHVTIMIVRITKYCSFNLNLFKGLLNIILFPILNIAPTLYSYCN